MYWVPNDVQTPSARPFAVGIFGARPGIAVRTRVPDAEQTAPWRYAEDAGPPGPRKEAERTPGKGPNGTVSATPRGGKAVVKRRCVVANIITHKGRSDPADPRQRAAGRGSLT